MISASFTVIKTHKCKNERQNAFKEITFGLDVGVFGIKYKRSRTTQKRLGKYKEKELKTLSDYVKKKHKDHATDLDKM